MAVYPPFNLNEYVWFTPTHAGLRLLPSHLKPDDKGRYKMQAWDFMNLMGPHLNLGGPEHLETTVEFEDSRPTSILAEAERITTQTRRDEYGHPFDNFSQIANEWSLELGVEVTPEQVGRMMIRVKMVRLRHNPKHRDSLVDISGYANCLDLIRQRREEKP